MRKLRSSGAMVGFLSIIALLPAFLTSDGYTLNVIVTIFMFSVAALGVRLLMLAGIWTFAQGAVLTIGSYTTALAMTKWGVSFWAAWPLAGIASAVFAAVIGLPVLRVRGVHFAILTMTLVFLVQQAIAVTPDFTNGLAGIPNIAAPSTLHLPFGVTFSFQSETDFYFLGAVMFVVCFTVMLLLERTRLGLILAALRQNEDLAQSVGIRPAAYTFAAFVLTAFLTGAVGGYSAVYYTTATPSVWGLWASIYAVAYAIVGGVRTPFGPILGTIAVVGAVELLRGTQSLQVAILGAGIIVVTFALPNGLSGGLASAYRRALTVWLRRVSRGEV